MHLPRLSVRDPVLGGVQLQLLLTLLTDDGGSHKVIISGELGEANAGLEGGSGKATVLHIGKLSVAHELEEGPGEGQIHQPVVLQCLAKEDSQEMEEFTDFITEWGILGEGSWEEPTRPSDVIARGPLLCVSYPTATI